MIINIYIFENYYKRNWNFIYINIIHDYYSFLTIKFRLIILFYLISIIIYIIFTLFIPNSDSL